MNSNSAYADDANGNVQDDLRQQVSAIVLERVDVVTADTVAIFPYSGAETLDAEYCHKLGRLLAELLALVIRDGRIDPLGGFVQDLHRVVLERALSMERLFTFAYLTERTTLDELALSETIGPTTEPWPLVAQLVRRASFDLLGAYAGRAQLEPGDAAIIDKLTTLHTRPMLDAVLAKEIERAGRFGSAFSLILFDVDRLSAINQHGYGVGDKVLERLGILIRQYFRHHDWVARYAEDSIAVLLNSTDADHGPRAKADRRINRSVFTEEIVDLGAEFFSSGMAGRIAYRGGPLSSERAQTRAHRPGEIGVGDGAEPEERAVMLDRRHGIAAL